MGLKDLIITPIYIIFFTALAIWIRPYVTNSKTRKYFLPALWVRFAGAIALGLIYQFYYGGGDTFNYWEHGSRWIWKAFNDDVSIGLKLILEKGGTRVLDDTYTYASRIWYFRDPHSYIIVKMAAVFDLITFHTYSASSLFFASFSFSGLWAMYSALVSKYSNSSIRLAIAICFVPSVIFWGSGILKDTVTLGALGWMTWSLIRLIDLKKRLIVEIIVFAISFWLIFLIKKYILICFVPMIAVWLFLKNLSRVKNAIHKVLIIPLMAILFGISGFLALQQITNEDAKYNLTNLAERAQITAYDIRYGWGARTDGDGGYDIGLPDGSWQSMIRLIPAGINVSLFRPYIWEVKNPLMLLSALEGIIITILSVRFILNGYFKFLKRDPFLLFCLGFSLLFGFAVGISTFNFGTLMRYKIPMMPFLLLILMKFRNER